MCYVDIVSLDILCRPLSNSISKTRIRTIKKKILDLFTVDNVNSSDVQKYIESS
ncbi:MAG: hypothetical protein sL5_09630 [Candidatus Mesenet longicola]|uniref:Uncharacterized protein n=1 Tax=Candidatus Mesenet longicola TaxID=1892558 RepID=A0A8J3HVL9_9RICK|nr:MAG: hypothetical protein sL5_09630 [Candidatus Mesenet longicola]